MKINNCWLKVLHILKKNKCSEEWFTKTGSREKATRSSVYKYIHLHMNFNGFFKLLLASKNKIKSKELVEIFFFEKVPSRLTHTAPTILEKKKKKKVYELSRFLTCPICSKLTIIWLLLVKLNRCFGFCLNLATCDTGDQIFLLETWPSCDTTFLISPLISLPPFKFLCRPYTSALSLKGDSVLGLNFFCP